MRLQIETFYDRRVLSWSKLLLSVSGLWPENHNDFCFFFYVTYIISCTLLFIVSLVQNIHNTEKVMRNITFTLPTILIVLKNIMFRWKRDQLLPLLTVVRENVKKGLYRNSDEKDIMIWYNVAATLFIISSMISLFFVPTLYYIKPIFECILSSKYIKKFKNF